MAMIAITMAAEAVENALFEQGAISALTESPEFAFFTISAATAWKRACSYFSLQLRVLGERGVRRALSIDPPAQHTFVVETDICGKQASVVFVYVVAQPALPLGVRADGLVKIHLDFPDQGGHRPLRAIG
jgi:hypothetical protein